VGTTHYTDQQPFKGPLSATAWLSRYEKCGFTEARDSEWQWHQLDHTLVCTSPQTETTPAYRRPLPSNQQHQKTKGQSI